MYTLLSYFRWALGWFYDHNGYTKVIHDICFPWVFFNPKSQTFSSKTFAWGMRNTLFFFFLMREEELWDFVTQEAQSVSAHWCSELAGLSLWSPINSAARLLPPTPCREACPYTQPTHCRSAPLHQDPLVPVSVLLQTYSTVPTYPICVGIFIKNLFVDCFTE